MLSTHFTVLAGGDNSSAKAPLSLLAVPLVVWTMGFLEHMLTGTPKCGEIQLKDDPILNVSQREHHQNSEMQLKSLNVTEREQNQDTEVAFLMFKKLNLLPWIKL